MTSQHYMQLNMLYLQTTIYIQPQKQQVWSNKSIDRTA